MGGLIGPLRCDATLSLSLLYNPNPLLEFDPFWLGSSSRQNYFFTKIYFLKYIFCQKNSYKSICFMQIYTHTYKIFIGSNRTRYFRIQNTRTHIVYQSLALDSMIIKRTILHSHVKITPNMNSCAKKINSYDFARARAKSTYIDIVLFLVFFLHKYHQKIVKYAFSGH